MIDDIWVGCSTASSPSQNVTRTRFSWDGVFGSKVGIGVVYHSHTLNLSSLPCVSTVEVPRKLLVNYS